MITKFKKNNHIYCLEKTSKIVQSYWGFTSSEFTNSHRKIFETTEQAQKYYRQKYLEKKRQGFIEVT